MSSARLGTMGGGATLPTITALLSLGLCWDLWGHIQAGVLPKSSIWADPGPTVTKGSPVTIWCQGSQWADVYRLYKRDASRLWETKTPQDSSNMVGFFFKHSSSDTAGLYQCAYRRGTRWSEWSHPLPLAVTGMYREPSLSARPGSLVLWGENLTLQCHSEASFDRFALTKDKGLITPLRLEGQRSPDFPLGRVNHSHGGSYRCYGGHYHSYTWSAPSAPLDILITGMYKKPSLSAHPGASVPWGGNVTLQCSSETWSDTFLLSREGSLSPPQHLRLQDTAAPFQANFTLSPVTSANNGTYRCYSSLSTSPYLLSQPSDPLELLISGSSEDRLPPTAESGPQTGLKSYLNVLIGVSVAFILLLLLLIFLLIRHQRQDRCMKLVAATSVPKDRGQQKSSSPALDVQENLYAVVKDTEPEDSRQLDSQAAAPEAPQDVTYAQLNHSTLRQETTAPPPSQSGEPSAEPSVYATLAIH
ncbi:Leukocyte immunoglobulin-like receptor subfamily B member 5 [Camelus dromedarius]|uniref:Leukocyte immunoglobulin-like receptor subfamily B member 1 n=1 Tax=Camelus dromedarius TaxID=9838 RepID=A0A516TZ18_CAMDR|nr:Leukocyte immunoglobulin-like receptor subfamily B member 5 [Camelus dromedarius]KAB1274997.1 Leukocyte immunoglobulin-like receptor subfamily B member 5 [Camelus dromedarius]QDQ46484.1 leukocyte immunoglobulin-like receptor subfamily B member 1 [Camelus dromedarius]QDQ46485.1 leukocyte immunoglobulin-like receptor subfamily B member 1 [Camelus dromedarius]QDQ46486.1 leukocyte immunoglobulin-like receptor subfamily B member 1 [Camelus dromedarius]